MAVAAAIVAIAAGLVALYIGKATWGTLGDGIAAVLWGLGISAAAGGVSGYGGAYETLTK